MFLCICYECYQLRAPGQDVVVAVTHPVPPFLPLIAPHP
jgi:hypothetical protein